MFHKYCIFFEVEKRLVECYYILTKKNRLVHVHSVPVTLQNGPDGFFDSLSLHLILPKRVHTAGELMKGRNL